MHTQPLREGARRKPWVFDLPLNCCGTLICFGRVFPGTAAFQLYSSMGFPLDLLTLMAEEKVSFDLDEHAAIAATLRGECGAV